MLTGLIVGERSGGGDSGEAGGRAGGAEVADGDVGECGAEDEAFGGEVHWLESWEAAGTAAPGELPARERPTVAKSSKLTTTGVVAWAWREMAERRRVVVRQRRVCMLLALF